MTRKALNLAIVAVAAASGNAQGLGTGSANQLPGTFLAPKAWKVYTIHPADVQGKLAVTITGLSGNADLYLRRGASPTLETYDFKSTGPTGDESLVVTNASTPPLTSETWYIGVYAATKCRFNEFQALSQIKAEFPGNGAVPWTNGTTFRVFAPNASQANVVGQFNNWNTSSAPMVAEGNGWYSLDYRNARAGQQYKFYLKNGTTSFYKNDPWARQLVNSVGNSIIYDESKYQWQTTSFQTPPWNKTVLYEMHVGAVKVRPAARVERFWAQ